MGTITRIINRFQKALNDSPNSLDLTLLERQLEIIHSSDESYRNIHSDICDLHANEASLDEKALVLGKHEETVTNMETLIPANLHSFAECGDRQSAT